ncbi:MAG: 30S ribosomal protein S18 [Chlamydiia bacterium]|nr:30S ribosomal protein S18 [Chlamydiia bacterium]
MRNSQTKQSPTTNVFVGGRPRRGLRNCPFKMAGFKEIDYKDVETLKRFITDRGKILPRRITGVSLYFQIKLTTAIKRARTVALLPFVSED